MWRLRITNGVQEGRALRLHAGINRIGRSAENHFQIPDSSVSSAHCELVYSADGVMVRDLNSTNGTYIDGQRVEHAPLRLGQRLATGNVELNLEEVATDLAEVPIAVPTLEAPKSAVSLTLPDGSLACASHPELAAAYQCTGCKQSLCPSCVRVIRRTSGDIMVFCTLCNGQCEPVLAANLAATGDEPKKSLLSRLADTLKIPFKGRSPPG